MIQATLQNKMSDKDEPKHDLRKSPFSARKAKKMRYLSEYLSKQESKNISKKVSRILKKSEQDRTEPEREHLAKHADVVKRISKNKERHQISEQRKQELEDSEEVLQKKCEQLAEILRNARRPVIYTGAGISTAASIPDYRGPQGVWTLLKKGEQIDAQDLSDAEPTLTHMCIFKLHENSHVRHVVSQNCDGLHVRSGLPRDVLSEVHGNMFIEICYQCKPHREYIRLFDVTENTGVRRHTTGRHCHKCGGNLRDTIVHFGEKGGLKSPYRWREAVKAANKCDLILCLGSSLKILKRYACLWCMGQPKQQRPNMVIVNLQWTPKDESATLKINGRCDDVMERVMKALGYTIPTYTRSSDPLFRLATSLRAVEDETISKKILECPVSVVSEHAHGISRSPTPSDSESDETDTSTETSSDSDEEDEEESTDDASTGCNQAAGTTRQVVYDRTNNKQAVITSGSGFNKVESNHAVVGSRIPHAGRLNDTAKVNHIDGATSSSQICLSRSERICNEAKLAMQTKIVSAKISEMFSNCAEGSTMHLSSYSNQQLHSPLFDPLKNGSFDPGPVTYDHKVAYLHVLQAQLEDLKHKQKTLKQQEYQHPKQCTNAPYAVLGLKETPVYRDPSLLGSQSFIAQSHSNSKYLETADGLCHPVNSSPWHVGTDHGLYLKQESNGIANSSMALNIENELEYLRNQQQELLIQKSEAVRDYAVLLQQIEKRQQNELVRLHQHYLLQEQLLAHTTSGVNRQQEMFSIYHYQQQLMLAQHSGQIDRLKHDHVGKLHDLDAAIAAKPTEMLVLSNKLFELQGKLALNGSIVKQEKVCETVTTEDSGMLMSDTKTICETVTQASLVLTSPSPTKSDVIQLENKLHSPNSDHSIMCILKKDEVDSTSKAEHVTSSCKTETMSSSSSSKLSDIGSTSIGEQVSCKIEQVASTADITDTQSAVTIPCASCSFIRSYGVLKRYCQNCKAKNGSIQTAPSPSTKIPKHKSEMYSTNLDDVVSKLSKRCKPQTITETDSTQSSKAQTVTRQKAEAATSINSAQVPRELATMAKPAGSVSHIDNAGKVVFTVDGNVTVSTSATNENYSSTSGQHLPQQYPTDKPVSHPTDKPVSHPSRNTLDMSASAMSINPTVSFTVNDTDIVIPGASNITYTVDHSNTSSSKTEVMNQEETSVPSNTLKVCAELTAVVKSSANNEDECNQLAADTNCEMPIKPISGRSHSQPQICGAADTMQPNTSAVSRHIRSHSTSEATIHKTTDAEITPTKCHANIESTQQEASAKKRKVSRCLSVPGWFGKGLNIKKKRR